MQLKELQTAPVETVDILIASTGMDEQCAPAFWAFSNLFGPRSHCTAQLEWQARIRIKPWQLTPCKMPTGNFPESASTQRACRTQKEVNWNMNSIPAIQINNHLFMEW
ncbi:MAG: hypothetical protein DRR42_16470 [Gammaproteobacteria bacterium]|nr:MAG: hypothetical protein DRR42_16470 [Gammaproteobacteria bacterium]